jgi:predicted O-methyltransferase YrrM
MIPDLQNYFRQFVPQRHEHLSNLEKEALREGIPIVGPVVGELLYILARFSRALHILELGTATGYSAIYLALACQETNGRLITLERNSDMAKRARANLAQTGLGNRVTVKVGDAIELMAEMEESFDLIFMDIDKDQYNRALLHCSRLLRIGGLLVTDNIGFKGTEAFSRYIFNHDQWRTVHLLALLPGHSPEDDALSLALRVR